MKKHNYGVGILGIGSCIPEKVITNKDLEQIVETSDDWILKRTGISERRVLEKDEPAYKLGVKASERAMSDAGINAENIDLIIVTTSTPDYLTPSTACIIQGEIGAVNAAAVDLNGACSGFTYGLKFAEPLITSGCYKCILLVSCEGLSKVVDWEDRATCVLFGDGAGAVLLGEVESGYGIINTSIGADGSKGSCLTIPCCHYASDDLEKRIHDNKMVLWMDGSEVFKFAVKVMTEATEKVLIDSGNSIEDVKYIIPHQANIRIIEGASKRLGITTDKMYTTLHKYGNSSSSSIPIALDEALSLNLIKKGDLIVLVGFGGGLTWGASLLRWSK